MILRFIVILVAFSPLAAGAGDNAREKTRTTVVATEADGELSVGKAYAQLRRVLWEHWRRHLSGEIKLIGTTTEGDPYTTTYMVEADETGVWRVRVQSSGEYFDAARKTNEQWSKQYDAYTVERIYPGRVHGATSVEMPAGSRTSRTSFRLRLKDRTGRVLVASL